MENLIWIIGLICAIYGLVSKDSGCLPLLLGVGLMIVSRYVDDKPKSFVMDVEYRVELVNQNTVRITNGYDDEKIHIDSIQTWIQKHEE